MHTQQALPLSAQGDPLAGARGIGLGTVIGLIILAVILVAVLL